MTVKNVLLGGASDWIDGDILYAADQNDTFDAAASIIKREIFTYATEVSTATSTTVTTFTFTVPVNSMIIGFRLLAELKHTNASGGFYPYLKVLLSGSNLGSIYISSNFDTYYAGTDGFSQLYNYQILGHQANNNDYIALEHTGFMPLKILDASTTITVTLYSDAAAATAYCKNLSLEIIYVDNYTEA